MCVPTEAARPGRFWFRAAARGLLLLLLLAGPAAAQQADADLAEVERALAEAEAVVGAPGRDAAETDALREDLLELRGAVLEIEAQAGEPLAAAQARLDELAPAPAEGGEESEDLRLRRETLTRELAEAQAPVLEARKALDRVNAAFREIDRAEWTRVVAELRTLSPSPLLPVTWETALAALRDELSRIPAALQAVRADPEQRALVMRRLPLNLMLLVVGFAITFSLRRWLTGAVEGALARAQSPQAIAWLVALRNASRLIVPAVGAGLLFAAVNPEALTGPVGRFRVFELPVFVLALIGASWLGNSLFSPRLAFYRLIPVDEADAAAGTRLVWGLGLVLALHLFLAEYLEGWDPAPALMAALYFPLFILAGLALWHVSVLLRRLHRSLEDCHADPAPDPHGGGVALRLMGFLERAILVVAVAAPVLAAIGYLWAAERLMFPAILTLGLIGTGVVLFDLLHKTLLSILPAPAGSQEGLGPVIIAAVLTVLAAPLLALIWGARVSDLARVWGALSEGVSLGGIRVSLGDIVSFVVVFGIVFGITRVMQSLLRSSVLPRTRMDTGGRNAVLAGVGYVGFFVAALAAISSTGIDLSSIAIVAGALSVGIGFGLQNVVSNFVSGIILLVERPIKEGDWIEVGGYSGYVRGISVRSTEIETFDRASVILPNQDLVAGTVLNWTHSGMSGRLRVPVSVAYDSDARQVEAILIETARAHPAVMESPPPRVLFMAFGADALEFEIRCWLRDVNFTLSARSDMNFDILERFRAAGIEIPFPQRDVQIKGLDRAAAMLAGRQGAVKAG